MAAGFSLQLTALLPHDTSLQEKVDFALRFASAWPAGGRFVDVIVDEAGEPTLVDFTTGPDAHGTTVESMLVEIEQPDLSLRDQDFLSTWRECGGPIANDLWATLAASIFVPNEELWPNRTTFEGHATMPLIDAIVMLVALKDEAEGEARAQLETIIKGFARAYELNVHITISP